MNRLSHSENIKRYAKQLLPTTKLLNVILYTFKIANNLKLTQCKIVRRKTQVKTKPNFTVTIHCSSLNRFSRQISFSEIVKLKVEFIAFSFFWSFEGLQLRGRVRVVWHRLWRLGCRLACVGREESGMGSRPGRVRKTIFRRPLRVVDVGEKTPAKYGIKQRYIDAFAMNDEYIRKQNRLVSWAHLKFLL